MAEKKAEKVVKEKIISTDAVKEKAGIKKVVKEVIVANNANLEDAETADASTFKMQVEVFAADKDTKVDFIATYVNGNNIKKTKRLTTIMKEPAENLLGYLRYKVAPVLLEEADPEFVKVLKVVLA